jgi:DNA helicase-2/ATP-dependent DNA helicase PcrA
MDSLSGLNEKQKEAVLHQEGPLLVLAGAGAGKTKMLTHRILNLIEKGVSPSQILAVTFTNKASKEMRDRVGSLISKSENINRPIEEKERPFVSTFHSLGVHILRHHGKHIGIPKQFKIIDRDDCKKIIKKAIKDASYDPKQYEIGTIISIISRQKGDLKTPEEYEDGLRTGDYFGNAVADIWRRYERELNESNYLDFDDLLVKTVILLRQNPEIRNHYISTWKYIHIDEYQDTNEVQYQITLLLTGSEHNICVVGDIDQNIYSWRGATIRNILHFEKDFPEAKIVLLEQNYRSTANILTVANTIIQKNKMRREKNLFTKNEDGEKLTLYNAFDENDEASFIANVTKDLIDNGANPKEISVLYRANFQSRVLEEKFLRKNIPYQVLGVRFFERKEVKDVLAYINSALNPKDMISLSRIINTPTRGIGKTTFLKICEGKIEDLPDATKTKVRSFYKMLSEIENSIKTKTPHETLMFIIKESGLEDSFKKDKEEDIERIENIRELVSLGKKYDEYGPEDGINKLLEDAALASDQDELDLKTGQKSGQNGVKLMTIHASKGLEFDTVFISGLEQGLFPHDRFGEKKEDEEEERRLFYVALTRARKKIYLSYAGIRTIFGAQEVNTPSEFIYDIDAEFLENAEGAGWNDKEEYGRGKKEYLIDF